jgi:hypothetical protein
MLTCYLDEAGGVVDTSTVVAGFVSTVALWEQFEIDWKLLLASYKLPYFHMKEFSQSTGPFKKWKDAKGTRARFSGEAIDIIRHRVQGALFFFVHHVIFDMVNRDYLLKDTLYSPYAIAGRACVASVGVLGQERGQEAQCIFEDGGPDKAGLVSALDVSFKMPGPSFQPSRDITDKRGITRRGVVQLQAADFLAYELRKYRNEFAARSRRPVRQSFYKLLNMPLWSYGTFNAQNATTICQLENPLPRRIVP